jgi:hypothetical protein
MHIVRELIADHRDPRERGVEHVLLQAGSILKHQAEDGDEHQQQREEGEERVVRDQRGVHRRAVVRELACNGHGEGDRGVSPLPAVDDTPHGAHTGRPRQVPGESPARPSSSTRTPSSRTFARSGAIHLVTGRSA